MLRCRPFDVYCVLFVVWCLKFVCCSLGGVVCCLFLDGCDVLCGLCCLWFVV